MALKKKAQQVRAAGSKNSTQDSMLAHISPKEAVLLKAYGGSGRKDPTTGLPHYDDPGLGDPGVPDGTGVPADPGNEGPVGNMSGIDPSDFSGLFAGENSATLGGMAPDNTANTDTTTTAAAPAESVISKMFKGLVTNQVIGQIAKGLGIPGLPVGLANAVSSLATGQAPPTPGQTLSNFASAGLAGLGGIIGGPPGAAIGGTIGSAIGNNISAPDPMSSADIAAANVEGHNPSSSFGNSNPMFNDLMNSLLTGPGLGGLMTGLGGMYAGHQASNMYNGTMDQINNLYSPNSPYAQQMRQAMERKDAASGRRSQYGTRETQLAAALAQAHANALSSPGYANMMNGANRANQQGLNTLISLFNGKGGQGILNGLGRGASNWMAQQNNPNYSNEGYNYPSYAGGDTGGGGNYNYDYGNMDTGW